MLIPNIFKFGKAVIMSKIVLFFLLFVYKVHAHYSISTAFVQSYELIA